jgi:PAS domain S-box-containing protein
MRLVLAAGGALLLALLTWLLLSGINTNVSAYLETQRAFDDFALAEASIARDVLQARAGLLGNYDVLAEAEEAMESAVSRLRLNVEAENLDPKPVEALSAAVGQYESLVERFKTGNSLLQNSLTYVGQLSTDPAFGALGDQFAPSAAALAAAVLHLARDSSPQTAKSLQQDINRFEAQAPTAGLEGEAAHALLAHARLLSDLLPDVDQTLRAIVSAPTRQPFEETRQLLVRAQAAFEVTAQRFRILLYAVSLGLLIIALRLGLRLWTRTLRIRRLVDANIIGIFIWDFDGRILEANEAFLHMLGYDHRDLSAGRIRWTELTPPEWRDRDTRLIQEQKVAGTLQPFEKEYFRKDGSRIPVLIGVATFEQGGNQGVAFVLDLTERKRAEAALRRSDANLAEAQRLSRTGSWALSPAMTKILYWSQECYRIWGFDPTQGLPDRETVWRRIHLNDRDRVLAEAQEALRQKRDYTIEFRIVLPDGTVKYLEAIGHHLLSADGELVQVVGTNIDLTVRKLAEEALRESQAKFRDYAESASDWFWEIGPDYKFTSLTKNAFGSNATDRIGTACWDHALDLETEPDKWRQVWATLESRQPFRDFVYCAVGGDGSPMYVKASGKPVFDPDGQFRGYRGTGTDVTATAAARDEHERLRQLESDLAHINRLNVMGELTASLAHEIAQPLASARNNARAALNFLDRRPPKLDKVGEALAGVVGDADRAGEIIDRIRDHVRKAPPRKARFDLNCAIEEVIALARSAITSNRVSVQTLLAERLSPVEGDRVQLQQVILNLVLNAVEAMSSVEAASRELLISTEQTRRSGVLVTVSDSGPGIDPEHLERVFQAFYTTKSSGVGMGLSICRSIIDVHGGRLWADQNQPRGAAFRFTLPGAENELTN